MALGFPMTEGKAYDFGRGEITLGTKIYTAISNISTNQPIEEGVVHGAAAEVLARTRGQMQIGEGNVEFSMIEEATRFLGDLGDGWQEKEWNATYLLVAPNHPKIKIELFSCRLLDCELDHGAGPDGLGAALPFSFMYRLINGKTSLIKQRT